MIKRFFYITGVISLVCFSFFYTEKAADIIKKNDPIMKEIISVSKDYEIDATNALLITNNIIPGISGLEIDLDKSYEKMKRYGEFNKSLLVLKEVIPDISVSNTYDKYIIKGNSINNEVSIIIKLDSIDYFSEIIKIIDDKNMKVTFFVTKDLINDWLVHEIQKTGSEIQLLDSSYLKKDINDVNKVLKSFNHKLSFCYLEYDNEQILNACNKLKMHTIKPNINTNNTPYKDIKEKLTSGSIIKLEDNHILINELNTIINYINQKGYNIVPISDLIKE